MNLAWRHPWDVTPAQARAIQEESRRRVILQDDPAVLSFFSPSPSPSPSKSKIKKIEGEGEGEGEMQKKQSVSPIPHSAFRIPHFTLLAADVAYDRATNTCLAALVAWDLSGDREIEHWTNVQPATFPYVPGLLSFREIPALLPIFEALPFTPDLLICDGQGIAHPRRFGLATHLGVVLDCPTLGWAKSRLIGRPEQELPEKAGSAVRLLAPPVKENPISPISPIRPIRPIPPAEEQIGWVFRSRTGTNPTYVSPGHRVSMEGALALARALCGPYRLCNPARRAHELTRELLQSHRA